MLQHVIDSIPVSVDIFHLCYLRSRLMSMTVNALLSLSRAVDVCLSSQRCKRDSSFARSQYRCFLHRLVNGPIFHAFIQITTYFDINSLKLLNVVGYKR